MSINETVILLAPHEDCSKHRLARHIGELGEQLRFTPTFDKYFRKPLPEIFSRVILYDYLKRMMEIGVKGVNKEIIDLVRTEHPKYALWTSWHYEIQESTFEQIRKEGTIVVGWFFDDETRFDDYSKWWIPYLDYCVTNSIEAVAKYRELGAWATQAICTGLPIARDWSKIKEKYDVSFVGRKYLDREQYINELKNRSIPIHVFGFRWGGFIPDKEVIDIFGASKINLNFSKTGPNQLQLKARIFEVCLAGGFLVTEYAPGIENYFEIDKEIVCFKNAQEMVNKITYYLNHDEERRAIAQAGWKRATGEYTSFHVVSRVFGEIERDFTATKGGETSRHPQELKMPMHIRKRVSDYYLDWGMAFSLENYKGLWKDALALSVRYYPFNTWAWCHYIIGFFPSFMRPALVRLYIALLCMLGSIPYLRKVKQSLIRRLFQT